MRLLGPEFADPAEVIRWLGAVQSQDYGPAKWSLGLRTKGLRDVDVDRMIDDGELLRTHVLRPTWHFVLPEDIGWMLELTGPRIQRLSAYYLRQLDLDEATRKKSAGIIERALRSEGRLTRKEIQPILDRAGIVARGPRLAYIMMHAEITGLVCSGALRGRHHTYALIEDRAPQARALSRDEALAKLTRRYFVSHGPATVADFQWWSSLGVSDIRDGLEMVGSELSNEQIDGNTYWFAETPPPTVKAIASARLLQPFDEFLVGFSPETKHAVDVSGRARSVAAGTRVPTGVVVLDGQVAGFWRRIIDKDEVLVEASLFKPAGKALLASLRKGADSLAEFLGCRPRLTTTVF